METKSRNKVREKSRIRVGERGTFDSGDQKGKYTESNWPS